MVAIALLTESLHELESLHVNSFLFALSSRLEKASAEDRKDALAGAAAWTDFVFRALADAARDCGMVSCAARTSTKTPREEAWTRREYLFDVTWFRPNCTDYETPSLILEHENAWDQGAFLLDFWKILVGYAPVRVMMGYSRHKSEHAPWIAKVNEILADESRGVRLPADVEDLILLGHRDMEPTGYAVYRRQKRCFVSSGPSLGSIAMPDPADAKAWGAYVQKARATAGDRVHAEVERLRRANILDRDGRVLSDSTPPDMDPMARTSTVTG